jgi:hypothetical protein
MKKPKKFEQKVSTSSPSLGNVKRAERAILKTLSYRAIFNYPLSFAQLQNCLLTKTSVPRNDIESALSAMEVDGKISKSDDKFHLRDMHPVSWRTGAENSKILVQRAEKICKTLAKIPWIKFIGITGSVAAFNAIENDDIDILIITEPKRLWLTRGFTFVLLKLIGELRTDQTPGHKICPNILIDETHLAWARKNRNVYVAHEIAMLCPIYDREETYLKFLHANSWVLRFFGNLKFNPLETSTQKPKWNILDTVESLARALQIRYMHGKRTTEITKDNIIHFNRDDHTKEFIDKFEEIKSRELK